MANIFKLLLAVAVLIVVPAGQLKAQHHIGVRAGYGMGTIGRIQPAETTGSLWGLKSAGISYKYYGDLDKFANGIQIDFQYLERGFKRQGIYYSGAPSDTTVVYTRNINSVELPIFWHPYYTFFKGRLGVFLNLGVNLSYNISSTYQWQGTVLDAGGDPVSVVYEKGDYRMIITRDNKFSYGLVGGVGINYIAGRNEFYFEGRYYVGYSDILKNRSKYEGNPRSSPLDAMNFSIGYFYRLGGKKKEVIPYVADLPLVPVETGMVTEQMRHEAIHLAAPDGQGDINILEEAVDQQKEIE